MDGFLYNLHSINAGVLQGSGISLVLFILFINDLLTSTSSSIHSFADDTFLSSSFSFNPNDHASTDIPIHRNISPSLLSNDLSNNLVFLFHLISFGKLTSIPLLNMHLKSSVSSPELVGFSHLLTFYLYTSPKSVLL